MNDIIITIIIGTIMGFLNGIQGIGSSQLLIIMLLYSGVLKDIHQIAGTLMFAFLPPLSIFGVYEHYKKGNINYKVSFALMFSYTIFVTLGAKASYIIPQKAVHLSLSLISLLSSFYFFNKFLNY